MHKRFYVLSSLAVLFLLASFSLLRPARAQAPIKISQLEVDLWPEYDHPSVLVIYRITLPGDTKLPVNLTIRIPSSAGDPNAIAARQIDGTLVSLAYTKKSSGDWNEISFTATMPELQVEYYDPSLTKQGDAHHLEYTWPGDYAVDSLSVQVQQPAGATGMVITPSLGNGTQSSDGLTYYNAKIGSLAANQEFKLSADYQKTGDALSIENIPVQSSGPLNQATKGRTTWTSAIPWALGVLGLVLIGGGSFWYWRSSQRVTVQAHSRRGRRATSPELDDIPTSGGSVYCHQCGNRAGPGDRFCRICGSHLRTE